MNAQIIQSKPCRCGCGREIFRSSFRGPVKFERARFASMACRSAASGARWDLLMSFKVCEGIELDLEQIAEVAHVSRECIRQIEEIALRKLARSALAKKVAREW
jgi:hypothetical protein